MHLPKKLFLQLTFCFIIATIIGTLTHELGHYFVARFLGYDTSIHYKYTVWQIPGDNNQGILVTIGGPLQTMLTGTIGFALLFVYRKSFQTSQNLKTWQWFMIFLSLFWLRQSANFILLIGNKIFGTRSNISDEIQISRYFKLSEWVVSGLTAFIGFSVLVYVIFKYIPNNQRSTFIISGLVGGLSGYILWMHLVGNYILP